MVTRYVGQCPVCERDQKLHKLKMVHHGYRRPGDGEIVGDCSGVGWAPWELSPDGAISYLDNGLVPRLERLTQSLLRLKSGEVTELRKEDGYEGSFGRRVPKYRKITPADGREFQEELRKRIINTDNQVRWVSEDITKFERKINAWSKQPVRTEEEVERERVRMDAPRRAAIDEARAQRLAKRSALDAKQRAREQEAADLLQEYRDIFNRLAFLVDDIGEQHAHGVREEAKAHWIKMHKRQDKKSYLFFYPHKLESPQALVKLRLAAPSRLIGGDPSDPRSFAYSNELGWEPRS